jgi:hypothetical protein
MKLTGSLSDDLVRRAASPSYDRWWQQVTNTGYCSRPVQLAGSGHRVDPATGEILGRYTTASEPDGVLLTACGNRRAAVCPPCSATYRADTWQLVAAGLRGGKGIPDSVAEHPAIFATLTAPSFGPVHSTRNRRGHARLCRPSRRGEWLWCEHGRPTSCDRTHRPNDPDIGSPLCPDCFDYPGAVLFNALVPELWRRTTIYLQRAVAARVGLSPTALRREVRITFTKVAEYQARGLVHVHAVIRFDGVTDEGAQVVAPPAEYDERMLMTALRDVARAVTVVAPDLGDGRERLIGWGPQLHARPIRSASRVTNPMAIAAYVAKYATKAAETVTGAVQRRLRGLADLNAYKLHPHARDLIETCWRLGARHDLAHLKLRRWAHMLGFGGHFSTRSRRYSVTLTSLRAARRQWRRRDIGDNTAIAGEWRYQAAGHLSLGDALLAATAAGARAKAAEAARAARRDEWRSGLVAASGAGCG